MEAAQGGEVVRPSEDIAEGPEPGGEPALQRPAKCQVPRAEHEHGDDDAAVAANPSLSSAGVTTFSRFQVRITAPAEDAEPDGTGEQAQDGRR